MTQVYNICLHTVISILASPAPLTTCWLAMASSNAWKGYVLPEPMRKIREVLLGPVEYNPYGQSLMKTR